VGVFNVHSVAMLGWRAVEAQHRVSTMALVDGLAEQHILEDILEAAKPPIPAAAQGLHWLLFTPFRYPPLPTGSRFRTPYDPGVFYAADEKRTACAELGYWRWRFLMDSQLRSIGPIQQTLFQSALDGSCIDLRLPPYAAERSQWTDGSNYAPCQALAQEARAHGVHMLRYESARDPQAGACVAVLRPEAFAQPAPVQHETWSLRVTVSSVQWRADSIFKDAGSFTFAMR
jgi:hypothetical protein